MMFFPHFVSDASSREPHQFGRHDRHERRNEARYRPGRNGARDGTP